MAYDPYASREIADSSKRLYMYNLGQLAGNTSFKNLNFLSDVPGITAKLEPMKPTTRRSYLIAIVSALKSDPSTKCSKLYTRYYPALEALNKQLRESSNTKSDSVKENWMSLEELKEAQAGLMTAMPVKGARKLTSVQYGNLFDLLLVSLYVLNPPRRNNDYCLMIVSPPTEDKTKNFYNKGIFYFNNFKTSRTYSCQTVPVSAELQSILDAYLKFRPDKAVGSAFLQKADGTAVTKSPEITKNLNRIFGKKVGSTMIRRSVLTGKFSGPMAELAAEAKAMGTSSQTAQGTYIKTD